MDPQWVSLDRTVIRDVWIVHVKWHPCENLDPAEHCTVMSHCSSPVYPVVNLHEPDVGVVG